MRIPTRSTALALLVAALLALAAPAWAHVTISTDDTAAGAFVKATLSVPHGCDESPTTAIRVRMPEGLRHVTPQVNPGWEIEVTEDGGQVTEVAWTGGPLAAHHLDEFGLSMQLPEDAAGQTLYFPIVQECESGEVAWVEIPENPAAEEPEYPAAAVAVTAASEDGEHDGHGAEVVGDAAGPENAQPVAGTLAPGTPDADGPLVYAALGSGLAGLALGAVALLVVRRRA